MQLKKILSTLLLSLMASVAMATNAGVAFATLPGKAIVAGELKLEATVTAIDTATRTLTLQGTNGQLRQVVAGPDVRNFAQIRVGDKVQAKLLEALTLELKKGGAGVRTRVDTVEAGRAEEGSAPAGVIAKKTTVMADVIKVNLKAHTIELKGVSRKLTLKIEDPEQLKRIQVGDQIKGTYVDALGISLIPQAAK
ncbi:hypothetical protein [Craterilacuibacter sinensis]|uniref:DUF5666 domain-containing protein n=1 Tax=Craterilacuibacter sinensis TaxID=2686017 RepID=A0A845BPG0_9NEIS|nr:hypothetical protein [Craterilacuibacter sinensis]MXR38342.1 hypothetical protein [Craterilacuibacter sinensis]